MRNDDHRKAVLETITIGGTISPQGFPARPRPVTAFPGTASPPFRPKASGGNPDAEWRYAVQRLPRASPRSGEPTVVT